MVLLRDLNLALIAPMVDCQRLACPTLTPMERWSFHTVDKEKKCAVMPLMESLVPLYPPYREPATCFIFVESHVHQEKSALPSAAFKIAGICHSPRKVFCFNLAHLD